MTNENLTQKVALLDHLTPMVRATNSYATGWIDASKFQRLAAVMQVGTLTGNASIYTVFQSATTTAGAGSTAVSSACVTPTYGSAANDSVSILELRVDQNPLTGQYVRAYVSVATSSWLGGLLLYGSPSIYGPASDYNKATTLAVTVY